MQNNTFLGHSERQRIIVVDKLPSTNDYLKVYASNFTPREEFTAIMAINQTAGRGQRDNTFSSTPGESLTFSFILLPTHLDSTQLFFINIAVSLGIQDWLSAKTPHCAIKWPNDIILNHRKTGGVLIENAISGKGVKHSIVGIGLNVLQTSFPEKLAHKATSLVLNIPDIAYVPLQQLCQEIIQAVKLRYQKINTPTEREKLLQDYNRNLYRRGIVSKFIVSGRETDGKISHVDENGLLHVDHTTGIKSYFLQDISMVI